ncbi:MAG: nucleoside kinase [Oscillospiraceae bacterium]
MAYDLNEINRRARENPADFIRECDADYDAKIRHAADMIMENREQSPIVLISGPSGSGKTTTSKKIEEELRNRGIMTYALPMDSYFRTVDDSAPLTAEGKIDLESPHCVDMDLLNEHFKLLNECKPIGVPKYVFAQQKRAAEPAEIINIKQGDVVVVEGIHALNDELTNAHPEALKLYISARSNVELNGELCFKGTWMRLMRRVVRDKLFRGASPAYTLSLWANVRRGEKVNISPFKDKAAYKFDSSFPYEVSVMKKFALELFRDVPESAARHDELKSIVPALELFEEIDNKLLQPNSLICEFVGGGKYKY